MTRAAVGPHPRWCDCPERVGRPGALGWRVIFRPPVSLETARDAILAALDDEGLTLLPPTNGKLPQLWAELRHGEMVVHVASWAIIDKPLDPAEYDSDFPWRGSGL